MESYQMVSAMGLAVFCAVTVVVVDMVVEAWLARRERHDAGYHLTRELRSAQRKQRQYKVRVRSVREL
jgi:hypothetical protein